VLSQQPFNALYPRTTHRIVVQRGRNADRARADDATFRRLPGRLYPGEDSLHEAVVEQLRAAIEAHTLTNFEGELPEPDESGAIFIPDVKVVLQLRTWQAIGYYVNELLYGCVSKGKRLRRGLRVNAPLHFLLLFQES